MPFAGLRAPAAPTRPACSLARPRVRLRSHETPSCARRPPPDSGHRRNHTTHLPHAPNRPLTELAGVPHPNAGPRKPGQGDPRHLIRNAPQGDRCGSRRPFDKVMPVENRTGLPAPKPPGPTPPAPRPHLGTTSVDRTKLPSPHTLTPFRPPGKTPPPLPVHNNILSLIPRPSTPPPTRLPQIPANRHLPANEPLTLRKPPLTPHTTVRRHHALVLLPRSPTVSPHFHVKISPHYPRKHSLFSQNHSISGHAKRV